jgi:putative ABC transport system permease protein
MMSRVPLSWLQLIHEPLRLAAATAGIAFAVILMLMQLGFEDALLSSAGLHFSRMECDLALVSPQYEFLLSSKGFPERRLYQTFAVDGVESVKPVYIGQGPWKNPWTRTERTILMVGFNPQRGYFNLDDLDNHIEILRRGDNVLFDSRARPEFGPIGTELLNSRRVTSEIAGRRVEVAGMFALGTSFAIDGTVLMSDQTFFRILPYRKRQVVNVGLIKLKPGFDPNQLRTRLAAALPNDVTVLTHSGLVDLERNYWATNTPVGFVFRLGLLIGLLVGCIIVYQILYTDVMDHLSEYATLKAMGYPDRYLFSVVIQESIILSMFGFVPGLALSMILYQIAGNATLLPLRMPLGRVVVVYFLTAIMCTISGALAMRKLRKADPAEIF